MRAKNGTEATPASSSSTTESGPKLRQGRYFPPFLEARKTLEKALVAVIQEACIGGVSTRRVDDLVQAMGLAGISKSTVRAGSSPASTTCPRPGNWHG